MGNSANSTFPTFVKMGNASSNSSPTTINILNNAGSLFPSSVQIENSPVHIEKGANTLPTPVEIQNGDGLLNPMPVGVTCETPNRPTPALRQSKPNILSKSLLTKVKNVLTKSAGPGVTTQSFYAKKLMEHAKPFLPASPIRKSVPVIKKTNLSKNKLAEPVCLTISSDEEPDENVIQDEIDKSDANETRKEINPDEHNNENCLLERRLNQMPQRLNLVKDEAGNFVTETGEVAVTLAKPNSLPNDLGKTGIRIECRSIRIGSYKVHHPPPSNLFVDIDEKAFQFTVPTVTNEDSQVLITMYHQQDIPSLLICFDKKLHVIFLYTNPGIGVTIRSRLEMTEPDVCYYDPTGSDDTCKRITIIPTNLDSDQKAYLRSVFPHGIMTEINQLRANELLVRSTPQGNKQHVIRVAPCGPRTRSQPLIVQPVFTPVIKLLTYPPPPQTGGITITSEDLLCLNEGEFLNDAIIDFYLKYLLTSKICEIDQKRSYVFSTFFFNRLTQKMSAKGKSAAVLNSREARHARVKNWTRNVDIFEKDFLIVPVNQTSHWFLAIICFPGMVSESSRQNNINSSPILEESSSEPSKVDGEMTDSQDAIETTMENEMDQDENAQSPSQPDSQSHPEHTYAAPAPSSLSMKIKPAFLKTSPVKGNPQMESMGQADSTVNDEVGVKPTTEDGEDKTVTEDGKASASATPKQQQTPKPKQPLPAIGEKQPCIIIFDSLPGTPRWRIVTSLREYLAIEYETKKGVKVTFDRYSMIGLTARVPRQSNFHDCGVYLLQYVESFFENPFKWFKSPLPALDNWFLEDEINTKRIGIKELVFDLQKKCASTPNTTPSAAAPSTSRINKTPTIIAIANNATNTSTTPVGGSPANATISSKMNALMGVTPIKNPGVSVPVVVRTPTMVKSPGVAASRLSPGSSPGGTMVLAGKTVSINTLVRRKLVEIVPIPNQASPVKTSGLAAPTTPQKTPTKSSPGGPKNATPLTKKTAEPS